MFESHGISRIREREKDDGFTAAWQRGQAPSQTNQPTATGGAYRGSDDPLRSEPLSQRRAPPLAPSNVYTGCPIDADIHVLLSVPETPNGTGAFQNSLDRVS